MWRAPEGPEGTGGLRGTAPNDVRQPSLASGRARVSHSLAQASPNWRPPWGLAAVPVGGGQATPGRATHWRKPRPIGGRRGACRAWPGFEPTRRAKLAARTASGRAGPAAAGDQARPQAAKDQARPQAAEDQAAPRTPARPRCGDGGNRTPVPTRRTEQSTAQRHNRWRRQGTARTPARHSKRGRHQPTPCASALTHP